MARSFRDKIALSGVTVLMIGVALLIFTFLSAFGFLSQNLSIIASADLVRTFGEALAPLIATCIRVMYLGVMGWVGSLLTVRGVTLIAHAPKMSKVIQLKKVAKPIPKTAKTQKAKPKAQRPESMPEKPQEETVEPKKPEESEQKVTEPEVIFIPPEQATQPQVPQEQWRENDSSQQPSSS